MTSIRRVRVVVRKTMIWATIVAMVAAATSCSRTVDGRAVLGQPKVGVPIEWGPCDDFPSDFEQVEPPPSAQCGRLAVPVDYAKPDGDTAALALIKIPATGEKIGSLVINPGGPGESGVKIAAGLAKQGLPPQIRERFDLVGFDPRGVADSSPAARCNSAADWDRLRADPQVDYSPEGVARIEQEIKEYVQRCVEKMGKEFLANVGTASVVKDLDMLRAALGDPKLTYLGYSYGSRIGSAYAEAFPDNVRAMVLDGAIDPNADPIEADIRQAAAFQQAFDDYAADCAESPACPLGTDPAKAVEVYHSLVDPLVENPVPTKDPRGLSYSDAIVGTILAMYSPSLWKPLTKGLKELENGTGDTLLAMADSYMGRGEDGEYSNSTDARSVVNCVDQPPVTDRARVVDADRRYREAAPFLSYGEFTGHAPLGTCAFWPVPPTSEPHEISVEGLPPILVISTTNDPATPYQAGVDLAKQLGGTLLTFEGTQHTIALQGNECVDDIVMRYLIDVTVPPPGTRCDAPG